MAGQYLSPHQRSIVNRFYANTDARVTQRLSELVSDLAVESDPKKVGMLWQSVHTQLKSTPADQMKVGRLIAQRDLQGLATLIEQLTKQRLEGPKKSEGESATPPPASPTGERGDAPAAEAGAATSAAASSTGPAARAGPSPDMLKSALSAFKKRLKVSRLDAESKLGGRGLTGGRASGIVAIQPPSQFPKAVWDALVAEGKLRYSGSGLYELKE